MQIFLRKNEKNELFVDAEGGMKHGIMCLVGHFANKKQFHFETAFSPTCAYSAHNTHPEFPSNTICRPRQDPKDRLIRFGETEEMLLGWKR